MRERGRCPDSFNLKECGECSRTRPTTLLPSPPLSSSSSWCGVLALRLGPLVTHNKIFGIYCLNIWPFIDLNFVRNQLEHCELLRVIDMNINVRIVLPIFAFLTKRTSSVNLTIEISVSLSLVRLFVIWFLLYFGQWIANLRLSPSLVPQYPVRFLVLVTVYSVSLRQSGLFSVLTSVETWHQSL